MQYVKPHTNQFYALNGLQSCQHTRLIAGHNFRNEEILLTEFQALLYRTQALNILFTFAFH